MQCSSFCQYPRASVENNSQLKVFLINWILAGNRVEDTFLLLSCLSLDGAWPTHFSNTQGRKVIFHFELPMISQNWVGKPCYLPLYLLKMSIRVTKIKYWRNKGFGQKTPPGISKAAALLWAQGFHLNLDKVIDNPKVFFLKYAGIERKHSWSSPSSPGNWNSLFWVMAAGEKPSWKSDLCPNMIFQWMTECLAVAQSRPEEAAPSTCKVWRDFSEDEELVSWDIIFLPSFVVKAVINEWWAVSAAGWWLGGN